MRCTIPEISWHNRDPVLSIDIQAGSYKSNTNETFWRVATGGADSHVLIWHLTISENCGAVVKFAADLERHQKAVNIVRFSPSKDILASGDDESNIVLWKQKEECEFFTAENSENKEQWSSWKVLRGHIEDVYDISWSPDSNSLISGSVDNTAILWDIHKGRSTCLLSDHKGFVQGVSWDPCNQYACTISSDRQCRLIDISKQKIIQKVHKSKIPTPSDHPLEGKIVRLFHDDTFKSFFRRLTFSPDGVLIIVPSGIIEPHEATEKTMNATIIFSRYSIKEPIMVLPSLDETTIAVRCCPVYFKLQKNGPSPLIALPYRIIFAVATQRSVLIYDTQQTSPIAVISNIHYTRLTDVSWSSDGKILIVSSTDGYCSIIHFQEGELGQMYTSENSIGDYKEAVTENHEKVADVDNSAMDVDVNTENLLNSEVEDDNDKVLQNQEEQPSITDLEETEDIKLVYMDESEDNATAKDDSNKKTPLKIDKPITIASRTPRRVKLITLSSPKSAKKK